MKCNFTFNGDGLGIVILCPDCNLGGLKYTANSIGTYLPSSTFVAMVGCDTPKSVILDLSKYSRVCKGGRTITSLIDAGMREVKAEWYFVVMSGSQVRASVLRKYGYFVRGEKDILYPVIDRKYLFDEASINGILLSRKACEDIGEFGDEDVSIQESKLHWCGRALEKGYCFKALVGASLMSLTLLGLPWVWFRLTNS